MIKTEDISVVVQGAINKEETPKCLKSIRKFLPEAEIILSTWEGSDISAIDGLYDVLLLNKDPGCGYYYKNESGIKSNNLNRQLVSTREGLKKATKNYAMKIRTDIILTSDKFLKYYDYFPKRDEKYSLFKHKIIASSIGTRFVLNDYITINQFTEIKLAFHVSDWWFMGLKEDLILYFDVPLTKEPDFSNYYKKEENKNKFNPYINLEESYVQFSPEQYFAIKCFEQKFNDIQTEHAGDVPDEQFELSRKYMINNFIFAEYSESGIYFKKYLISRFFGLSPAYWDMYNKFRQQYEYKKYCDTEYQINKFAEFILSDNSKIKKDIRIFLIHLHRIRNKQGLESIFKELFITFLYSLLFIRYLPQIINLSIKNFCSILRNNR